MLVTQRCISIEQVVTSTRELLDGTCQKSVCGGAAPIKVICSYCSQQTMASGLYSERVCKRMIVSQKAAAIGSALIAKDSRVLSDFRELGVFQPT